MAIKEIFEGNTSKVIEATQLLSELSDREGQYVWKKYESKSIEIKLTMTDYGASGASVIKLSSDRIDFNTFDFNSLAGIVTTYRSGTGSWLLEFVSETAVLLDNSQFSMTWYPATAEMRISGANFGVIMNIDPVTMGEDIFTGYVVADDSTAYPTGGLHTDGYWYETVEESTQWVELTTVAMGNAVANTVYTTKRNPNVAYGGNADAEFAVSGTYVTYYYNSQVKFVSEPITFSEKSVTFPKLSGTHTSQTNVAVAICKV